MRDLGNAQGSLENIKGSVRVLEEAWVGDLGLQCSGKP